MVALALLAASAAWIAFFAHDAWAAWPVVPLDLSPGDAETQSAYDAAIRAHVLRAALVALTPPMVALGVVAWLRSRFSVTEPSPQRTAVQTVKGPKRVLLFRHAEKTGDEDDIHLSKPGYMRAKRLAAYIPETFGAPDFIFAAARSKRSIRSMETVSPLALSLGKPVNHEIEDKNFPALVRQLFSDAVYSDATVVVCWHHNKLPEIARLLGAQPGTFPDPWPYELYDAIIAIDYAPDGVASARQIKQPF